MASWQCAPSTCFYNSDKEFLSGIANGHIQTTPPDYTLDKRREVTAPAGAVLMRVSFQLSDKNTIQIYNNTKIQTTMAVISRGQITIVDLNDGKSINLYLGSSQPTTQIFNKENSSFTPSWSAKRNKSFWRRKKNKSGLLVITTSTKNKHSKYLPVLSLYWSHSTTGRWTLSQLHMIKVYITSQWLLV